MKRINSQNIHKYCSKKMSDYNCSFLQFASNNTKITVENKASQALYITTTSTNLKVFIVPLFFHFDQAL